MPFRKYISFRHTSTYFYRSRKRSESLHKFSLWLFSGISTVEGREEKKERAYFLIHFCIIWIFTSTYNMSVHLKDNKPFYHTQNLFTVVQHVSYLWGQALVDKPSQGASGQKRCGGRAMWGVPFKHLLDQLLQLTGVLRRQWPQGPLTYFENETFPAICLKLKGKTEL